MAPAAPTTPSSAARLASGAPARQAASGGPAAGLGGINLAALKSLLDDSVHAAVTQAVCPLHEELGALKERVQLAEHEYRHSDSSSESRESVESGGVLDDEEVYLAIDA